MRLILLGLLIASSSAMAAEECSSKYGRNPNLVEKPLLAKALDCHRQAALRGETKSKTWIGLAYYQGNGLLPSNVEAAKWLNEAALEGSSYAAFIMGDLFRYRELPLDNTYANQSADYWYVKALNNVSDPKMAAAPYMIDYGVGGSPIIKLWEMYMTGLDVARDWDAALNNLPSYPGGSGVIFRQIAKREKKPSITNGLDVDATLLKYNLTNKNSAFDVVDKTICSVSFNNKQNESKVYMNAFAAIESLGVNIEDALAVPCNVTDIYGQKNGKRDPLLFTFENNAPILKHVLMYIVASRGDINGFEKVLRTKRIEGRNIIEHQIYESERLIKEVVENEKRFRKLYQNSDKKKLAYLSFSGSPTVISADPSLELIDIKTSNFTICYQNVIFTKDGDWDNNPAIKLALDVQAGRRDAPTDFGNSAKHELGRNCISEPNFRAKLSKIRPYAILASELIASKAGTKGTEIGMSGKSNDEYLKELKNHSDLFVSLCEFEGLTVDYPEYCKRDLAADTKRLLPWITNDITGFNTDASFLMKKY